VQNSALSAMSSLEIALATVQGARAHSRWLVRGAS